MEERSEWPERRRVEQEEGAKLQASKIGFFNRLQHRDTNIVPPREQIHREWSPESRSQRHESKRWRPREDRAIPNGAPFGSYPAPPPVKKPSKTFDPESSILDKMDVLFDTAEIEKTPVKTPFETPVLHEFRRKPIIRQRESTPPDQKEPCSSQQAFERGYRRESYRYDDDMRRKREFCHGCSRKRKDENRYEDEYRRFPKKRRPRENSSSSERFVRFEDRSRDREDQFMHEMMEFEKIIRREKELEDMLSRAKEARVRKREQEERERENQKRMAANVPETQATRNDINVDHPSPPAATAPDMASTSSTATALVSGPQLAPAKKKRGRPPAAAPRTMPSEFLETEKPSEENVEIPPRGAPKRRHRDPQVLGDNNESVAARKLERTCVKPPVVDTRLTWTRRDLERLRQIIDLKKPTANLEDWREVTKLLMKGGVDAADVKMAAERRLEWKHPAV